MNIEDVKAAIIGHISDQIDLSTVTDVEINAGSCWIDTADGKTYSLSLDDCEQLD